MERLVLTVPAIASEHSIHAISRVVDALAGARLTEGTSEAKQVTVEFDAATITLDQIKAAMAAAGYPVAAAWAAPAHHHGPAGSEEHGAHEDGHGRDGVPSRAEDLVFTVRLLRDGVTAVVGYQCACGCKPQARYVKDSAEAGHEHCCCGLAHFAGSDATRQLQEYLAQRRADGLDGDRVYVLGERQVAAPWGGTLTVAFAIPQ